MPSEARQAVLGPSEQIEPSGYPPAGPIPTTASRRPLSASTGAGGLSWEVSAGIHGGRGSQGGPPAEGASPDLIHEHKVAEGCFEAIGARIQRFSVAHRDGLEMSAFLTGLGYRDRARKLERCGSWLLFRHFYTVGETKLAGAEFCQQDRLCAFCAMRRGAKLLARYVERVLFVVDQARRYGFRRVPYMVNHTVKDGGDLRERFEHLQEGYRRLWKRAKTYRRGRGPWTEAARVEGAVSSVEVKRGKGSGEWHPHIHAVWLCESELDERALQEEWEDITGDSRVVYARPFRSVQGDGVDADGLAKDMVEVFKYAVKFSEMSQADRWHAFEVLFGRRLIASRGELWGVKVPQDLTDEISYDELPFIELLYRWRRGDYWLEKVKGGAHEIRCDGVSVPGVRDGVC